jgi:hypothetical protein
LSWYGNFVKKFHVEEEYRMKSKGIDIRLGIPHDLIIAAPLPPIIINEITSRSLNSDPVRILL